MCVNVAGDLSGTLKSAQVAQGMLQDREIHVIDSRTASMGVGQLVQIGAELAAEGVSATEIARVLEERKADVDLFVALDTLEYLKRGGRISGAQAAVGTMLIDQADHHGHRRASSRTSTRSGHARRPARG